VGGWAGVAVDQTPAYGGEWATRCGFVAIRYPLGVFSGPFVRVFFRTRWKIIGNIPRALFRLNMRPTWHAPSDLSDLGNVHMGA